MMSIKTSTPIVIAVLAGLMATSASAATILADDFAGVTKVGSTATIASWNTEDGVTAGTSFSAFNDVGGAANYLANPARASALDVNASVWGSGDGWDITFTVALNPSTAEVALNTFDIASIVTSSGGGDRFLNQETTYAWTLNITGDNGYGTQSATSNMTIAQGGAPRTGSLAIDLSGLDNLVNGENYTFSIGVRLASGDQTYMALQSVALDGEITAIPEPASLAMGLTGLAMIAARRHRA
jgi:hypothetical protein